MRVRTLATLLAFVVVPVGLLAACAHDDRRAPTVKVPEPRAAGPAPSGPVQYIPADPGSRTNVVALALGPGGGIGLVVDRARIATGRGEPRASTDAPDSGFSGAARIPSRLGGGFLFWTDTALYRSDSFEGALKPLAAVPDSIQTISFAPKFLLVRTRNGERWALALPSGDRARLDPLGVADVEGLDDGRALAFNDQGAAFSTTDGGAHWTDVTSHVKSSPVRVAVVDDELWLFESSGAAHRLEPDGQLTYFDKQPPEPTVELRPRDPRWHSSEAPLREAFRGGASIDDNTALVVADGDLVRVDVRTGEITSVLSGKVPPDATCDAVPVTGDVLFACAKRGGPMQQAEAFVLSHTLSDEPRIEQTFPTPAPFFASDDGGLVFSGPCSTASQASPGSSGPPGLPSPAAVLGPSAAVACVRQPGGTWQEVDASQIKGDAGVADVTIARWVPRADGRVVALVTEPTVGIFDPRTGALVPTKSAGGDVFASDSGHFGGYRKRHYFVPGGHVVDWGWTFTSSGSLRGWDRRAGIVEIAEDGAVIRSPYSFELVTSGSHGLGRSTDGRLFQSVDHGASWSEVAGPPSGSTSLELRSCSSAGCDLGGFYRVGWLARPPRAEPPPTAARAAPSIRRGPVVELSCRPAGPAQHKAQPRTDRSPEDLGLGQSKLPVQSESSDHGYLRVPYPRWIVNPLHDPSASSDDTPALRALFSGYQTTRDSDVITVMGPNKSASSLRRAVTFVPAFDPAATIRRGAILMSDVLVSGRAAGMTTDEILTDDMTEAGNVVVVTSHDPGAASDVAFHNTRGLIAFLRSGAERARVGVRASQNEPNVISGVALGGDEVAFLEVESSGVGHVFKLTGAGVVDLFDVNPTASDTTFYPANPDALAVGPKGDLAILRTASGSDPASAVDPALLVVPSMPPVALAPWSTLRLGDDPACKSDPGWRATLQVIVPWVRTATPELRVDDTAPMLARVKWNERRVCLEGLEIKVPAVSVRVKHESSSETVSVGTWLVSRGGTFARVGVGEGVEWRQALECSLVPTKQP